MTFLYNILDLTHTIAPGIPTWQKDCGFNAHISHDYADSTERVKFRVQNFAMPAGIGTHLDAPRHCFPQGKAVADLVLSDCISSCIMIDVSSKMQENYLVSADDIKQFEQQYGIIPKNNFVIIRTGWEQFWNEPEKYHNNCVFPSVSFAAAELLLAREIVGLGIDTLSPDILSSGFPVHHLLLGAGKYLVENIANAAKLPPTGSYSLVLPLKIQDATESPVRLIGLVPREN